MNTKQQWKNLFIQDLSTKGFATASGMSHFANKTESWQAAQELVEEGVAIHGHILDERLKDYLIKKEISCLNHYPISLLQHVGLIEYDFERGRRALVRISTDSVFGAPLMELPCTILSIRQNRCEILFDGSITCYYIDKENLRLEALPPLRFRRQEKIQNPLVAPLCSAPRPPAR